MASKRISHRGTGVLLCLVLTMFLAGAPRASAKFDQEGCRSISLVNYGAPLTRMAPIHRPPGLGGQLPFAPHGVTLEVVVPRVQAGGGNFGFAVSGKQVDGLGWTVVSELSRVSKSGTIAKVLRSKRQRLNRIDATYPRLSTIGFKVGNRPGFYRMDGTFFDSSGHRLGSYAEYFRVLKPRTKVRQSISPTVAHPGDLLITSTEDFGTTGISFGNDWAIERYESGEWILDSLTPRGFAGIGITMPGGVAHECRLFRLPMDTSPGQYRLHKVIELPPGGPKRDLYAEFVVGSLSRA